MKIVMQAATSIVRWLHRAEGHRSARELLTVPVSWAIPSTAGTSPGIFSPGCGASVQNEDVGRVAVPGDSCL